jgi:hypothetical protein
VPLLAATVTSTTNPAAEVLRHAYTDFVPLMLRDMVVYGWPLILFIVLILAAQIAWARSKRRRRQLRRRRTT